MNAQEKERLDYLLEKLPMKQRLFVEAYFKNDYNGSQAVLDAGYKVTNGNQKRLAWQLLQKDNIKEIISLRAKEKLAEVSINEEFVIRKLIRTINKAEDDNNLPVVLRGLELAARNLGMLRDKTEITGKDGDAIKMETINADVSDFTRMITNISKRRKGETPESPTLN